MVVICVFTLEIIDFRPKIIGEKILVPQIFKSALQVLLNVNLGIIMVAIVEFHGEAYEIQ